MFACLVLFFNGALCPFVVANYMGFLWKTACGRFRRRFSMLGHGTVEGGGGVCACARSAGRLLVVQQRGRRVLVRYSTCGHVVDMSWTCRLAWQSRRERKRERGGEREREGKESGGGGVGARIGQHGPEVGGDGESGDEQEGKAKLAELEQRQKEAQEVCSAIRAQAEAKAKEFADKAAESRARRASSKKRKTEDGGARAAGGQAAAAGPEEAPAADAGIGGEPAGEGGSAKEGRTQAARRAEVRAAAARHVDKQEQVSPTQADGGDTSFR